MLGETVVIRKTGSQLQMANRPDRQAKATPGQLAVQERFQFAAQYARQQMEDPAAKELYTKGITESLKSARIVAVKDYLNAPKVRFIETVRYKGAVGNTIMVNATDDFMVTRVEIAITDSDGTILETGEATKDMDVNNLNLWLYTATVANPLLPGTKIKAVAYDRPGNKASLELTL